MKNAKIKILVGLMALLAILWCIPTQNDAAIQKVYGKKGYYNGLPSCTCPSYSDSTCACMVPDRSPE